MRSSAAVSGSASAPPGRVPDPVASYLRGGGDDGADEALPAGGVQDAAEDAGGGGIAALDGGGGEQQLAHQRLAQGQVAERRCLQVLRHGLAMTGGQGDPGQQQA